MVALEAAAELAQIRRLAAYEPPLTVSTDSASWNWIARYDREVAAGQLGAALVTIAAGTGDTSIVTRPPRFLAEPFLNFAISAQAKQVKPGEVPLEQLVLTMHDDAAMVRATAGREHSFNRIRGKVLLMSGRRSPEELHELAGIIPDSSVVELKDADHLSATNGKRPRDVATELRSFFS